MISAEEVTYKEFEKKAIDSGETDKEYLKQWWGRYHRLKFLVRYF